MIKKLIVYFVVSVVLAVFVYAQFTTLKKIYWGKQATLSTGDNIVIVLNPVSVTGGTIVFDKTVPADYNGIEVHIQVSGAVPQ